MQTEASLALRLLARQWRAGDLRLMAVAAVLAVTISTLIAAIGDRLEGALVHRAADLLGADLVLNGGEPAQPATLLLGDRLGLARSQAVDFSTMLAAGDRLLLASVRAADDRYPLRGKLVIAAGDRRATAAHGPRRGEIWIDTRIRDELGVAVGARVEVGYQTLTVSAILLDEPERGSGFMSAFSARALMHLADLAASGIVQPGSRVRWRTLFAGDAATVAAAREQLPGTLAAHEELTDVHSGSRRTVSALARTTQFLSLAAVLGVVLCGAAIGIAADRQSRRLYDTVALLRTFGLAQRQVVRVLAIEVLLLAAAAGLAGTLCGLAAQELLVTLLAGVLPDNMPPPGAGVWLTGFAAAAVTLPAFALPPLLRLAAVSPLRVLRRDLEPPAGRTLWQYTIGMALLALLVVFTATDRKLAVALLGGTLALVACTVPLAAGLLRLFHRLRPRLPFPLRLAADRLAHAPFRFGAQLVAFALILATMTLASLLRDDLLANWQKQLPASAPNVFALNLLPHEHDAFQAALRTRGIEAPVLYPVTPGRLTHVGSQPLAQRIEAGSDLERSLDRDLSLTQSATYGVDNRITAGRWWPAEAPPGLVSVEAELAGKLGLAVGDTLTFTIAGETVQARVGSLRSVEWESFRPNFYMIFSPGTLAHAPYTFLASFRATDTAAAVRELRREFPAMTLIEVGPLLARMNEFVGQLSGGIEFVLLLLLVAALLLLGASVVASQDERLAEAALLRVLGARRPLLRNSLAAEFALLGGIAGLLALVATEVARALLYERVMDMDWQPLPLLWIMLPLLSALLLAVTGYLAARRSLAAGAGNVLRED